jgi:ABC-type multidrug transport system ATPase subunit
MDAMSFVGLDSNDKRHVKKYSLGMRQRLKIAEAIMIKPDIMILDEPLNGLDPEGISQVKQLITHLNSQFGITVLVSSHLIKETKDIATEYVIIHHGKLITTFDSAELPNRLKCICLSGNDVGRFVNQINSQFGKTLAVIPCSSELRCYTTDNVTTANLTTYIERLKSSIDDEAVKISESQGTLDEYFLAITRGDSNAI